MTEQKFCRRCLLQDMPEEAALAASLRELIEMIPEEERSPAALTGARLAACRACPRLSRGTCSLCGCYVEHRAERRSAWCPEVPPRWPQTGSKMP